MTEAVVNKGPEWIQALSQLTPLVAIALLLVAVVALFVYGQRRVQRSTIETIETVSKTIVTPLADSQKQSVEELKGVVSNHLAHDAEDRRANTEALTRLVECVKEREGKA
ncbi:MAG: hypothetical protein LLG08_04090 [Actinomycetia bacterium]|nr:hypothetical protein [Actinomycetes bacterium]